MPFWVNDSPVGAAAADVAAERLQSLLGELAAPLSELQRRQLATYLEQLLRWNRVYNLTAVVEPVELVRRHLGECLALVPLLVGQRIADLGTGAGMPGLVLAVAEPHRQFWLLESVGKKTRFLAHVLGELALANVHVYHGRIEAFPASDPFDTVVARALAPVARLVELAGPLLGQTGRLVALKGEQLEAELEALPGGFHVETIAVLSPVVADGPPPRAVVIRPDPAV